MTLAEQIQKQPGALPLEKQSEVLDFIAFLQGRVQSARSTSAEEERKKQTQTSEFLKNSEVS